jgi:c-di-GMP-binding flagellar brake protein YcgR
MFMKTELRESTREPISIPVQYSVVISKFREMEKITDSAVAVDISTGGIGLLTRFLLEAGHIMIFDNQIKMNGITAKIGVVRWVDRSDNSMYRAGLKFI